MKEKQHSSAAPDGRARAIEALARLLAEVASGSLDGRAMGAQLRRLADRVDPGGQTALPGIEPPPAPATSDDREVVSRIFMYWQTRLDHPTAKLTPERAAKIRARLADGYSEATIQRAIRGCAASPHHTGTNETQTRYDDLTLILRNGSKLEQFAGMAKDEARVPVPAHTTEAQRAEIEALQIEAMDALERGDTHAYTAANRKLKERLR